MRARRGLFGALILVPVILLAMALLSPALAQRGDDLDRRPYDADLLRLAEILGALHYLHPLCGHDDQGIWRGKMTELLDAEDPGARRRAELVESFNEGYRGFERTYRSCTESAGFIVERYLEEGGDLAGDLARRHGG